MIPREDVMRRSIGQASCAAALAAALLAGVPVLAAGGGGGGGGSAPSASGPAYDPAVEYQKGVAAFQAGQYKDAASAFRKVVDVVPRNAQAQYMLGASLLGAGEPKKAIRPLDAAVKYDAKLIEARRDLGVAAARSGDAKRAQEQLAAVKALQAICAGSCTDAAKLAGALAAIEAAIAAGGKTSAAAVPDVRFADAAAIDGAYVTAVGLINEHRYDEAITLLDRALWTAGPHPDLLTYLGFAHRKLRHFDRAEQYYRAALAVAHDHRGAIEYYGELKVERGDLVGARAHLARLDRLCGYGCYEADELRRWIAGAQPSAS
jgi:tetratricopeptide (TPR) repeat protein